MSAWSRRWVATLAAALITSAGLAACGGGGDASLGPDGDVAVQLGSGQITNGQIERRATFLATVPDSATGQPAKPPAKDSADFRDFRLKAAEQLVDERVFAILAARCGAPCRVTDKEIDAQIKELTTSQFAGKAAELQKALDARGITLDDYKASLRSALQEQRLTTRLQDGVTYTDAEALAYYKKNLAQYRLKAERRLSYILLGSQAAAEALRSQLTADNFAEVAKEKSLDPAAKSTGGDLGPVSGAGLLPELAAAATALKPGQISKPVETQFGWGLLLVRDIKARTKTFDEVKKDIKDQQLRVKQAAAVQKWRDTAFQKVKNGAKYLNPKVAAAASTSTTAGTSSTAATSTTTSGTTTGTAGTTTGGSTGTTGPASP